MSLVVVAFSSMNRKATVRQGTNILNAAFEAGVVLRAECGGNGVCGKCKVLVNDKSAVGALTEAEKKHLSSHEVASGYRLACQIVPRKGVEVVIPRESRIGERKILVYGFEKQTALNPFVKKFHVKLNEPSLSDVRPDLERLLAALADVSKAHGLSIDYAILKKLPDVLRRADWDVTIAVWGGNMIIAVEPGDTTNVLFGFAVDIGTSKIVGHLVDLTTGKTVCSYAIENPQLPYGADIMTRVAFAIESEDRLQMLQKVVVKGINKVLARMCTEAKIDPDWVYEAVLVGNTAMHHLSLGIQPKYTALSPYVPAVKGLVKLFADELGLRMSSGGVVSFLPVIAGFVGADAVADVLATGFHRLKKASMLIDVGTNTEVFVGNFRDVLSCSCASGPAFEGARIKQGMKAEVGAIERVRIGSDFEVEYIPIGKVKPVGLCGSAMIDIVAELFKVGLINSSGRFSLEIETARLKKTDHGAEFVVAWADETETKKDIVITQRDVGEIQLAKAAIFTGCSVLMQMKNLEREDLDRVFVAGTFGNYINPENAKLLGLVPDVPTERIEFVGNTALSGARMALISREAREAAEALSRKVRYLELATAPRFNRQFAEAMFIPHRDLKKFPSVSKYLK